MAMRNAFAYGVLIDLSGTIHIGNELILNCKQALQRLRHSRIPYRYVTNTTKESKHTLVTRLQNLGLEINANEVHTSLTAVKSYIVSNHLRPHLLLSDDALNDFKDIPKNNPNAVIVGLAPERFNYESMNTAFQYILEGAELIAVHKARYYKSEDGLALGPGPFVAGLEYAMNTKAVVIGKPEKEFFLSAVKNMDCADDATIFMIGDDGMDDIHGAQMAGLQGILVRTGKYRWEDELKIKPPAHRVVDCFPEAIDYILNIVENGE